MKLIIFNEHYKILGRTVKDKDNLNLVSIQKENNMDLSL